MSGFIYCSFLENYRVGFSLDCSALEGMLYLNDRLIAKRKLRKDSRNHKIKFNLEDFDARGIYKVKAILDDNTIIEETVNQFSLYQRRYFNEKYTYNGELGAIYSKDKTTFRLWAPLCSSVELRVYNSGTPLAIDKELGDDSILFSIPMSYIDRGVWSAVIDGDLEGKYYNYVITNYKNKNIEVVDPVLWY